MEGRDAQAATAGRLAGIIAQRNDGFQNRTSGSLEGLLPRLVGTILAKRNGEWTMGLLEKIRAL